MKLTYHKKFRTTVVLPQALSSTWQLVF